MQYKIERVHQDGLRFYQVTSKDSVIAKLPSVTTILGETKDKSGLEKWRKKVGDAEADRISLLATSRGTIMHRLIELYKPLQGTPDERLVRLKELAERDEEVNQFQHDKLGDHYLEEAWKFFYKFYFNHADFFDRIKSVVLAEEFLWTTKVGGWAGTVDNISEMVDGTIRIIDYKNSRRPKKEEWVQDYYLQAAAYYIAYWDRYHKKANGAEIWIANEQENIPQLFSLTESDLEFYTKEFIRRRKAFKKKFNI
jgi:genome maintenance exonuclease 1